MKKRRSDARRVKKRRSDARRVKKRRSGGVKWMFFLKNHLVLKIKILI